MKQISYQNVEILDGFWKSKETLNRTTTVEAVWEQFVKTGRIDAFRFQWKPGMEHQPHFYWDSDVAKWMEAAAYLLSRQEDKSLQERVEWLIDQIEQHQESDGYFNIYFTVCEPEKRFQNRDCHELYCAGHLIEAAVAYYEATGRDRFLKLMMHYADLIYRIFAEEGSAAFVTPGHEEIELALVRLYRCTGEKKYLKLAQFFIDQRGEREEQQIGPATTNHCYEQSSKPLRQLTDATGHAVRACYLYSGMADVAMETGDKKLYAACEALFEDITRRKMYLTGGIGSTYVGEAFTTAYDLPNGSAYAETCAAISLMMFARRMSAMKADSQYQDVLERAMYNGMLSGLSLDGTRFFYENPLELNQKVISRHTSMTKGPHTTLLERPEIFGCSCCPPNLNRILASIGNFCYGIEEKTVYVHQFMSSTMDVDGIVLQQTTAYPTDGTVHLSCRGAECMKVRIPGWCSQFNVSVPYTVENGYAVITELAEPVTVTFAMEPILIGASPRVWADEGKAAVMRGPIVYCLEGVDHKVPVHSLYFDRSKTFTEEATDQYNGLPVLHTEGWSRADSDQLYMPLDPHFTSTPLTLIPYHTFANRGATDMAVWIHYLP